MSSVSIVTGVGYGDEGKGVTTKWLCDTLNGENTNNVLVVRFGGGNQVGHTTMYGDFLHTHHHTGSGSLLNIPTWYSRFCTVDPIMTVKEVNYLAKEGFAAINWYDPRCMIVTPLDAAYNRARNSELKHGSVGVGFGATVARNEAHYRLYVADIFCEEVFIQKCKGILNYYTTLGLEMEFDYHEFYDQCLEFLKIIEGVSKLNNIIMQEYEVYPHLVFEGHQGALLDKEYGVFPHVTRSKTTCYNAYRILEEELGNRYPIINHYMITRSYHTRHGNGYFLEKPIELKNNQWENNTYNEHQGAFKVAPLDPELLDRGVEVNLIDTPSGLQVNHHLVMTCCDQVDSYEDVLSTIEHTIVNKLNNVFVCDHPAGRIKEYVKEEEIYYSQA